MVGARPGFLFKNKDSGLETKLKTMNELKKNFLKISIAPFLFFLPLVVYANAIQDGLNSSGLRDVFGTGGLNAAGDVNGLIRIVVFVLLGISGAIAVVFVIIGGFQYLTSGGNEEAAEKGKKTLINAIIGTVIIIMAYVIINVIVNLVSGGGYY